MHEFLFFMIGFLLGGVIGMSIMCLMQINRIHGDSNARKEDDEMMKRTVKKQFWFSKVRKHRICRKKQRNPA
ncbi:MAG: DUF3789 domain-containing protein [Ruminococcus sp.]